MVAEVGHCSRTLAIDVCLILNFAVVFYSIFILSFPLRTAKLLGYFLHINRRGSNVLEDFMKYTFADLSQKENSCISFKFLGAIFRYK